jgi:hypothetical protein
MKVLLIAVLAISIFFIAGFASRRADLAKPEAVELAVFSRAKFAQYQNKFVLIYPDSRGRPKLIYDPDLLMVYPVGQPNPVQAMLAKLDKTAVVFDANTPIRIIDLANPIAASAAGSLTLGYSAKDLLTNPSLRSSLRKASYDKRVIVGLLASVTGWALGRLTADSVYVPDISSPQTAKLVTSSDRWHQNDMQLFVFAIGNAEVELQTIADGQVRAKAISTLNASVKTVAEAIGERKPRHLKSQDIKHVFESLEPFRADWKKSADQDNDWAEFIKGLLWFPLLALGVGVTFAAGCGIYSYIREVREARFPKITRS